MPSPWTAYRPDCARPNARALVAGRRACTKAAAAASWYAPPAPARVHSSRTHHSGGSAALPISGTQDKMASQPIIRILVDGAAILLSTKAPTTMPNGMAAISNPTVTVLPCRECAYGAASPSGTM